MSKNKNETFNYKKKDSYDVNLTLREIRVIEHRLEKCGNLVLEIQNISEPTMLGNLCNFEKSDHWGRFDNEIFEFIDVYRKFEDYKSFRDFVTDQTEVKKSVVLVPEYEPDQNGYLTIDTDVSIDYMNGDEIVLSNGEVLNTYDVLEESGCYQSEGCILSSLTEGETTYDCSIKRIENEDIKLQEVS